MVSSVATRWLWATGVNIEIKNRVEPTDRNLYGVIKSQTTDQCVISHVNVWDQSVVWEKGISVGTNRDTNWQFAPRQTK